MVEQGTHKPLVGGSSPPLATENSPNKAVFLSYNAIAT